MSTLKDLADKAKAAAENVAHQVAQAAHDAADRVSDTKNAVVEGAKHAVDAAIGHKDKE